MEKNEEIKDNDIFFKKETITQTPEDGFVPVNIMRPANPNDHPNTYFKGYGKTVTFTTDDPRVTRPFAYGVCGLFFVIGIILLLFQIWILAIPFIAMSVFGFYKSKKSIDAKADELKKKGRDVTIDSKEELIEVAGEVADAFSSAFEESTKGTFTKERYQWFLKATIPIYSIIVITLTLFIAIFFNIIFAFILFVALVLLGVLYYKLIEKIFKY